ncbi:tachykinin-3b [Amphiprion ocellaris]|uniref:tachykinin-3b n=1 Tax=Amphiprion ocellaris TaxID=80972 RepID=UPI0024117A09|nr:tachykinin-3b [Amphiprion ocellaris]
MGRTANCCTAASLAALIILVLFPVRSMCKEEIYKALREAKPDGCLGEDAALKRFDDIDYDSFVSLMGRRSAAQPNSQKNMPVPRKRHIDEVLADLLGQRTSE